MNQSQSKYLKHIIANPVFNGGSIVKKNCDIFCCDEFGLFSNNSYFGRTGIQFCEQCFC